MKTFARSLVLLFAAAACSDAEGPETVERLAERRAVYRQACAARELATRAEDDVATLENVAATVDPADPLAEINRRATAAALGFATAYQRHAELRAAAYAYLDSAVNHSASRADSIRYAQRSDAFTIRFPRTGSVEENVLRSYQENYTSLLGDDDHPCNWDLPF